MKLTEKTFNSGITLLKNNYLNWDIPDDTTYYWFGACSDVISEEIFPIIIMHWVRYNTTPPTCAADFVAHGEAMVKSTCDSADIACDLILNSAQAAYWGYPEYRDFEDRYTGSFAETIDASLGITPQEVYIHNQIRTASKNSEVVIYIFDELKGEVKDCFIGDTQNGISFLRTHIKKKWEDTVHSFASKCLLSDQLTIARNLVQPQATEYLIDSSSEVQDV